MKNPRIDPRIDPRTDPDRSSSDHHSAKIPSKVEYNSRHYDDDKAMKSPTITSKTNWNNLDEQSDEPNPENNYQESPAGGIESDNILKIEQLYDDREKGNPTKKGNL